jgi:DNA repair protein RadC
MRHVIVEQALALLAGEATRTDVLSSPQVVRDYLSLRLAEREHEVFTVVFLDVHLRVIETVELFRGTLAQTAYSTPSRTPFRCDGGQHSAVMADAVPR